MLVWYHTSHTTEEGLVPPADACASAATSQTTPLDHIQQVLPEEAHVLSTYLHVSGTVWAAAISQQGF